MRKPTISFAMSVLPSVRIEQLGFHWTDFHEIFWGIFQKSVEKIQVSLKSDDIYVLGSLHKDLCTFTITSRSVLLRIRNVSDKGCSENQNTFYVR